VGVSVAVMNLSKAIFTSAGDSTLLAKKLRKS